MFDYIADAPWTWPVIPRRIFVLTFPLSFPLWIAGWLVILLLTLFVIFMTFMIFALPAFFWKIWSGSQRPYILILLDMPDDLFSWFVRFIKEEGE